MAVRYEIEDGVLVLSIAVEGFLMLRNALDAAAADPRARPKMPVLLDVRHQPAGVHYGDVRWRMLIVSQMRQQFGPRWAILTGPPPVRVGIRRMFAVLSEIEDLEVGMFAEESVALTWLREATAPVHGTVTYPACYFRRASRGCILRSAGHPLTSSLKLINGQLPLLGERVACLFESDPTFRKLCEQYQACAVALDCLASHEALRSEYAELLLRLEAELLQYLHEADERSARKN